MKTKNIETIQQIKIMPEINKIYRSDVGFDFEVFGIVELNCFVENFIFVVVGLGGLEPVEPVIVPEVDEIAPVEPVIDPDVDGAVGLEPVIDPEVDEIAPVEPVIDPDVVDEGDVGFLFFCLNSKKNSSLIIPLICFK